MAQSSSRTQPQLNGANLSRLTSIPQSRWSEWFTGSKSPTASSMQKAAQQLKEHDIDISPGELLDIILSKNNI